MEEEERTLANNTEMAIQQECQRFQEEQNREESAAGDLASVITDSLTGVIISLKNKSKQQLKVKERP